MYMYIYTINIIITSISIFYLWLRNRCKGRLMDESPTYISAGLIWKTGRDMQEQTIFIGK